MKDRKLYVTMALLALAYLACSKFGFIFAFSAEQVTVIWPPTGLALAAVLLWGNSVLPAIALGAFLANITTHEPLIVALGITTGNVLEAWAGAVLLRRFAPFTIPLLRVRDVLAMLLYACICSTMLSANIGVFTLCAGGVQPWSHYSSLWFQWWLGDMCGDLIIAPLLLIWLGWPHKKMVPTEALEIAAIVLCLLMACSVLYLSPIEPVMRGQLFTYLIFAMTIWAALRFGQRGTVLITFATWCVVIWFAAHGQVPFMDAPIGENMLLLQIFMGVVACMGLVLGAAISERANAEKMLLAADRRKNEFLAILAHELRSPLSAISNGLHLLQADKGGTYAKDACALMAGQLKHILRLVGDLLDVTRIAQGKIELKYERIPLADVIGDALAAVKPVMQEKRQRLSVRLPREALWLNADASRLTQIFTNLLTNAAKYTPQGGHIAVDAGRDGDYALVYVKDNGRGIPADLLPKIFDLYMQVHHTQDHAQGGLGIGLTLVKRLVEQHGGSIIAISAGPDQGSEFIVRLPLEYAAFAAA